MRVVILAGVTGLFLAALAVVIWQSADSGSDGVSADTLGVSPTQGPLAASQASVAPPFDGFGVDVYRGPLAVGVHPSVWVNSFPTVALVTVGEMGAARWSTASGKFEGLALGAVIYTPTTLSIDEYIKGSGERTIQVAIWGGVVDGVTMDADISLTVGDRAVVFLRDAPPAYGGPIVDNAYVIDGDGAYSKLDEKQISVASLLSGLRTAAAASVVQPE